MPKIRRKGDGTLRVLDPGADHHQPHEWWLERREGSIVLIPAAPNVRKLYLEPTTRCNLRCLTCVRHVWEDPTQDSQDMQMDTFRMLLEQARDLTELRRIVFCGSGEPFSHPHVLEMMRLARNRDLAVSVTTNGLLLDAEVCRELVAMGVDRLMVSIDGAEAHTYADVRGARVSQVIENMQLLNDAKRRLGALLPTLEIGFVALKRNVGELGGMAQLAADVSATHIVVSNVIAHSERMYREVLYGYAPVRHLTSASWPVRLDDWVVWGTMDLPRMHWGAERRCSFVHDEAAVVGWDGAVVPCNALAHDYRYYTVDGRPKQVSRYVLGRIHQKALADIWTSEEYCRFRADVRRVHFPSCPDCDLRDTCDLRQRNEACWGCEPSCADCLYAQDIVRCPGAGR